MEALGIDVIASIKAENTDLMVRFSASPRARRTKTSNTSDTTLLPLQLPLDVPSELDNLFLFLPSKAVRVHNTWQFPT